MKVPTNKTYQIVIINFIWFILIYKYNLVSKYKPFLSKTIPSISIEDYLERIKKYAKLEQSTLVLILIYIDRVCNLNQISLNYYNIHK